ncbi:MAG TPA: site-specific integrase [Oligoflexia bacterium]|nr:site-specific integrase [Oligoflexia bacterium]HMP49290.1 site-specific integrase [Oligoflexia bacterium]
MKKSICTKIGTKQMAKQLPFFFQNTSGYYYFRYVLPRGLPTFFTENGQYREIKLSFRTKNKKMALEKYKYTKRFILDQINSGEIKMSYLEILETAKKKIFNQYYNQISGLETDSEKLKKIVKTTESPTINKFANLFKEIERAKNMGFTEDLNNADTMSQLDVVIKATQAIQEELKETEIQEKKKQLLGTFAPKNTLDKGITVKEIIEKFGKEKVYAKIWRDKTRLEYQSTYDKFFKRLKIEFISEITSEILRSHKDWLIQQNHTPQTVNKNLSRIDTLLKWAVSQDYIKTLPTTSTIRVQAKGKTVENREALSIGVLRKIFNCDFYSNPRKGFTFDYAYQYWIPLIGLYSGMRINEVCQLYCEDIKELEGELYFDVNANTPDKSLKTKSSKRFVPIHPVLIDFGLMELVEKQRSLNQKLLFTDYSHQRDGYGHYPSRWYNGKFRKKIEVVGKFLDFHAFRHTFTTKAIDLGHSIEHIQGIVGHSNDTITRGTYGKSADLKSKHQEIIKNINYDLDLNKIVHFSQYPFRNGRNKNVIKTSK